MKRYFENSIYRNQLLCRLHYRKVGVLDDNPKRDASQIIKKNKEECEEKIEFANIDCSLEIGYYKTILKEMQEEQKMKETKNFLKKIKAERKKIKKDKEYKKLLEIIKNT